jgi:hypothetical protein
MIMGLIYWMFRQQMRNMPGGLGGAGPLGRGGKGSNGRGGGGGFFGMARANVKEADKNAKDKVRLCRAGWAGWWVREVVLVIDAACRWVVDGCGRVCASLW